ncbi:hypothetical protein AZA_76539 [Nitrospirillum viridazoti Y2]|nr:hypothetical protein AZA_76539 [Nitrospirillum amazonense Y2]
MAADQLRVGGAGQQGGDSHAAQEKTGIHGVPPYRSAASAFKFSAPALATDASSLPNDGGNLAREWIQLA